jgi:ketosteroid isomerase-like protein
MSNVDAAHALLTAINFDRFAEIQARHHPAVTFHSFRGPVLRDSVSVGDWQRAFARDWADCSYEDIEDIDAGDVVVTRSTISAKGYDWRAFTQRVVEVMRFVEGEVLDRRLYGMLRDVAFDKLANAAMENALGFRGGSESETRATVEAAFTALLAGDSETAKEHFHEKPAWIDGVYGGATGFEPIAALFGALPRPAFGVYRIVGLYAAEHTALVEVAVDPSRPRSAHWVRLVDGKIIVVETYWMLREIGIPPDENYANDRHRRQVILPT